MCIRDSCWAVRQQEHDLRHVQRVATAPLWLPSFGARNGNGPRHPLHRVGVLGSGGRHSPATSVGSSEPRHCGRPELKRFGRRPQRGLHKQRLHFKRCTPCMSGCAPIEVQPLAVACWPSASAKVAIGRHAGNSTFGNAFEPTTRGTTVCSPDRVRDTLTDTQSLERDILYCSSASSRLRGART